MEDGAVKRTGPVSRWRRSVYRVIAVLGGLLIAAGGGELILRFRDQRIGDADRLDPGLIRYDPMLGWALTPGWSGQHRSTEFVVRYTIDGRGFRADGSSAQIEPGEFVAVVGDSFSFGLGVDDGEAYVSLLNRQGQRPYVNFSVPGFSTDQELLLIEREILPLEPDAILLAVCLVNDLMDNERSAPLQFSAHKPRFELTADGLRLRGSPVPAGRPARSHSANPVLAALGEDYLRRNRWLSLQTRSSLLALVGDLLPAPTAPAGVLHERLDSALALFRALVGRLQEICEGGSVSLFVVLLPGRSSVERPGSLSAQYQAFLLREVIAASAKSGLVVLDAATPLQRRFDRTKERLFYRHDGHLNVRGHRAMAEIVGDLIEHIEFQRADAP